MTSDEFNAGLLNAVQGIFYFYFVFFGGWGAAADPPLNGTGFSTASIWPPFFSSPLP